MPDPYDLVIIGGGVAGLSAGIAAARLGMNAILVERLAAGGQIINADVIENYPGLPRTTKGPSLATTLQDQASAERLDFSFSQALSLDITKRPMVVSTDDEPLETHAVILAVGSTHAKLGVPGEAELEGHGVSYCATCDGAFYRGKDVAVIGGGDSALDEGLYLAKLCHKVTVLHDGEALTAQKVYQERARRTANLEVVYNAETTAIQGGDDSVQGVAFVDRRTGQAHVLPATGVFVYVGMQPATGPFAGVIPVDAGGHIKVGLDMATDVPGVFAAGDCRWRSVRQLAACAGDGVTAAFAAHTYVRGLRR